MRVTFCLLPPPAARAKTLDTPIEIPSESDIKAALIEKVKLYAVMTSVPSLDKNAVSIRPATIFAEKVGHLLPKGVFNVIHGFGPEAGKPLASSPNVDKVAFTGETTTGQLIMQYASKNLHPVTMELGGKSPNVFFNSIIYVNIGFSYLPIFAHC